MLAKAFEIDREPIFAILQPGRISGDKAIGHQIGLSADGVEHIGRQREMQHLFSDYYANRFGGREIRSILDGRARRGKGRWSRAQAGLQPRGSFAGRPSSQWRGYS